MLTLLDDTGLIRNYARPLTVAKIDFMYLSTFLSDLVLVPEDQAETALNILESIHVDDVKDSDGTKEREGHCVWLTCS